MPASEVLERFEAQARAVAAEVTHCRGLEEALAVVVKETADSGTEGLMAAPALGREATTRLKELCAEAGITLRQRDLRAVADDLAAGVTWVDHAAAATGTLVISCPSEDLRLATMLAETHFALVPGAAVAESLEALEPQLGAYMTKPPNYLAFITGASRTADIERILAIGAHGPVRLHILILEETS